MPKEKIQVGDSFIVLGELHFEKTQVTSVLKRVVTLQNGIKFNSKTMEAINSSYTVKNFDEVLYQELQAKFGIRPLIRKLESLVEDIRNDKAKALHTYKKLTKLIKTIS